MNRLNILKLPLGIKLIVLFFSVIIILSFIFLGRDKSYYFLGNFSITGLIASIINMFFFVYQIIWMIGLIRLKRFAVWMGILYGIYGFFHGFIEMILASEKKFYNTMNMLGKSTENISSGTPITTIMFIGCLAIVLFSIWLIYYHYSRRKILNR